MRSTNITGIIKQVSEKLKAENYPFLSIYLFGSFAKKRANKWSDIDVAVVSDKLKKNKEKNWLLLSKMAKAVDLRIELHAFTSKDFENFNDPVVYEIRTTGVRLA